jgi:hypothetical protein
VAFAGAVKLEQLEQVLKGIAGSREGEKGMWMLEGLQNSVGATGGAVRKEGVLGLAETFAEACLRKCAYKSVVCAPISDCLCTCVGWCLQGRTTRPLCGTLRM